MLKGKIISKLEKWKEEASNKALLIKSVRRIDFIFYKGKGLKAVSAKVFGPDSCVCRSNAQPDLPGEPIVKPLGTWPTDHKGVLVEMNLKCR